LYWGGSIPWVTTAEIDSPIIQSTKETITELGLRRSAAKIAPAGTLLMAMYGQGKTRGKTSILGIDAAMNQACAAIEPSSEVCPGYLLEYLRHNYEAVRTLSNSGGQENLSGQIVKKIVVALPTFSDQTRIAQVLQHANDLVSALEALIAKKQAIRQGMLQQLLTARTRLPGFREPWQRHRVSEMGEVLAGKALNVNGAGTRRPYLRTKNVLDGRIDLGDVLRMPMTDTEFERFRIERGDVLLNEGQSLELVGRCSMYHGEFLAPCAMQNQLLRFRAYARTSPEFAAQLFRHCQQAGVFAAIATQTTSVAHLGSSRLGNLRLLWPSDRSEQIAIAEVLSDADAEIAAFEVRLDKIRAVKQVMMQELLTGRTRLKAAEDAA
jgi:type I restriction enzyme S subunit